MQENSDLEVTGNKKVRQRFLNDLDAVAPWAALVAQLDTYYPKGGGRGRPPIGCEHMLRTYVAHQCLGLDLAWEDATVATTLLKFRRLLERDGLTHGNFEAIIAYLTALGLTLRERTIVDTMLLTAPPLRKNPRGLARKRSTAFLAVRACEFSACAGTNASAPREDCLLNTGIGGSKDSKPATRASHSGHSQITHRFHSH